LALKAVMVISLVRPPAGLAQGPTVPTEVHIKPTGTADANVSLWIPKDSVREPFLATADYIAKEDLPKGISYPLNAVGQAFTLGLWVGDGMTLRRFTPSIVVSVKYTDDDIPPAALDDEDRLHLLMYNPTTQSWVKLCGSVDIHENFVSAALSFATPLDGKGSSLMALAIDNTPPLEQVVDKQGTTTISLRGSNLDFQVLFETVEVGSHFEITILPTVVKSGIVKLFSRPIDIKGCRVDHDNPTQNNRELTVYPKPLKLSFNYDSDTLSRAGGKTGLTIVNLQNGQWIDEEALGSRVVRGDDTITVDTTSLGTFGMAAR
jgi:hypothetical protein